MRLSIRPVADRETLSEPQICASVEAMLVRCRAALALYPMQHELVKDILSLEKLIDETRNPKPRMSLADIPDDEEAAWVRGEGKGNWAPRKKWKRKARKEPDPVPILDDTLTAEGV